MRRIEKNYVTVPVGVNATVNSSWNDDTKQTRAERPKPKHKYVRRKYNYSNSQNRQRSRLLCEIVYVGQGEQVKQLKKPRAVNPACRCPWTRNYRRMKKLLYYRNIKSIDK